AEPEFQAFVEVVRLCKSIVDGSQRQIEMRPDEPVDDAPDTIGTIAHLESRLEKDVAGRGDRTGPRAFFRDQLDEVGGRGIAETPPRETDDIRAFRHLAAA